MTGRIGFFLTVCVLIGCFRQVANADQTDLPLRHALFHQFQGDLTGAYTTVAYYKLKGEAFSQKEAFSQQKALSQQKAFSQVKAASPINDIGPKMVMTQAGAAFELGLLDHGIELLSTLDEAALLPEDQSRLHLYLARDAYRRRDWPRFEQSMVDLQASFISSAATAKPGWFRKGPYIENTDDEYYFLQAEQARLANNFNDAERLLEKISHGSSLRFYGQFNLASAFAAAGEQNQTVRLLTNLTGQSASNYEQLMIIERADIALADIYAGSGNVAASKALLTKVTATHQVGPLAIYRLAHLSMQQADFDGASRAWHYLTVNEPWHPATVSAHGALAFSLGKARGDEVAFTAYQQGLDKIKARQVRLAALKQNLSDMQVSEFLSGVLGKELTLAQTLGDEMGHDAWAQWLASEAVQQTARQWQRLSDTYHELVEKRRNLNVLLLVDAEQQREKRRLKESVQQNGFEQRLAVLSERLGALNRSVTPVFNLEDPGSLLPYATAEEQATIERLQHLSSTVTILQRKHQKLATNPLQDRLLRLQGKVMFGIWQDLPIRLRQRQVRLQDQQAQLAVAKQRVNRIQQAEENTWASAGVSQRMLDLSSRTDRLLYLADNALHTSTTSLIAGLEDRIDADNTRLSQQLVAMGYDLARLTDARLAKLGRRDGSAGQ